MIAPVMFPPLLQLNLMDIDAEHLGIPDTEYKCNIKMPSGEFQRIVRDVTTIGDTCVIQCTKEGVKFSVEGDLGQGSIMVRANSSVDKEEDQVSIIFFSLNDSSLSSTHSCQYACYPSHRSVALLYTYFFLQIAGCNKYGGASYSEFCTSIPQLLHKSHTIRQNGDTQHEP